MKIDIKKNLVLTIITLFSFGCTIEPLTAGYCDLRPQATCNTCNTCNTCGNCSPCSPCEQKQALKDAQRKEALSAQAAFVDDEGFGDDSFRNDGFGTDFHTCDSCNSLI